jgi:Uri superfamily endonuclease
MVRQFMTGTYVILAELGEARDVQVGRRRKDHFEKGFYGYVGSALGGLEKRVARHLHTQKKLYWHIDYFLNMVTVRAVVYAETSQKKECLIALALSSKLASKPHFGCSDCNCPSHLFFCQDFEILRNTVLDSFKLLNLKPLETVDCSGFVLRQGR